MRGVGKGKGVVGLRSSVVGKGKNLGVLCFAVLLTWCGSALATSVVPIAVEELARRADSVVEARAVASWSQWESDHLIYTYTRFAVSRALKGGAAGSVVVRQMGGSAGGYTQKVVGIRHWTPGEEAVLFLRPSEARGGVMAVVGLMQGNFVVM